MRAAAHRLSANGLSHFVRDSGEESAPAAILLHGFPDSSAVWDRLTPLLCAAGFRIIAPDLRGFGDTDMPPRLADYEIAGGAAVDVVAILETLKIARAHLVGHDFGAPVAWGLAAQQPARFLSLTALSVGHPRAYLAAGAEQKRRSLYIVAHQMRGLCEWLYRRNDWALLRRHWDAGPDIDETIRQLSRPGRLTAGLNWYRANIPLRRMLFGGAALGEEVVRVPTLGVWPSAEKYLVEEQMRASAQWVDASWTYERLDGAGHWLQVDAPDRLAALLVRHWRAAAAA
jgi:pimeloyl-ACP methyl ester carboxylesterase